MAAFPDGVTALTGAFDINHFGATCLSGRYSAKARVQFTLRAWSAHRAFAKRAAKTNHGSHLPGGGPTSLSAFCANACAAAEATNMLAMTIADRIRGPQRFSVARFAPGQNSVLRRHSYSFRPV